ncbi:MAG: RodZ domain-containing protein [Candidatus Dojkabacteria bacterium]
MITAGEVLKNKRESLGKNLNTVSVDTKIQKRFLEYLENNQYEKFDSDVFASGFIKIYSKYLGLDVEKVLAVYRRSNLQKKEVKNKQSSSLKTKKRLKIELTPQLISITALSIFLLLVIGYIGYQIYKFQTPPQLTITYPTDEYESNQEKIFVKGSTDAGSTISINGLPTDIDALGYFEKEITLNEGANSITVTARKKSNSSLESTETLKVFYKIESEQPEQKEEKPTEFKVLLQISESSAWIKLDIDGKNKVAQILEPNISKEFTLTQTLTLVTGKITSTSLKINNEKINISASPTSGIGQVECNIVQNRVECK